MKSTNVKNYELRYANGGKQGSPRKSTLRPVATLRPLHSVVSGQDTAVRVWNEKMRSVSCFFFFLSPQQEPRAKSQEGTGSTGCHLVVGVYPVSRVSGVRHVNKAVAPSTDFWVLCMAYVSRANDDSQAASKQSCNGCDGENLERKEYKKVCSPRRYVEL